MAWQFASLAEGGAGIDDVVCDRITLCRERGFFLPPSDILVSDSDAHELQVFWAFESGRVCQVPEVAIACLEDVVLLPEGVVVLPSGACLLESIYPYSPTDYAGRFTASLRLYSDETDLADLLDSADSADCVLHLREPGETGYFHWMNSVLPRLIVAQRVQSLQALPAAINLWPDFARASVELLGLAQPRTVGKTRPLRVAQLWFPTPCVVRGDHFTRPPFYTRELQAALRRDDDGTEASDLIYLSRGDASVRRIRNEGAVQEIVTSLGFRVVTVGNMPFAEQADLFARARVLLSPHGAGLSNALFMRGGMVGEIVSRNRPWPTFRTLAGRLDLGYAGFIAAFDTSQTDAAGEGNEDIVVDVSRFRDFCEQLVTMAAARMRD